MKKRLPFALAISLVLLVSVVAAGRSQAAETAWTTLEIGGVPDILFAEKDRASSVSASWATRDDDEGGVTCRTDGDCDDHNPCTKDKCRGKGGHKGGRCVSKPQEAQHGQPIACDDGNACTSGDACQAAVCAGVTVPNGTACNDANACTRSDTCQAGSCTGTDPVACAASDLCHLAGTCNPATAACSNPSAPDGTTCTDTDACTRSDSCQGGACTGADPVVCSARDQCHVAGTCDPASGACSDPAAPDGTVCTDTDSCLPDSCGAGVCGLSGSLTTLIAFASGRDDIVGNPFLTAEIYLMNPDGTSPVRVTNNVWGDSMPSLSPNGKGTIVFDSNRLRTPSESLNTSDLFLMKDDGSYQTFLARGSSASWSPDSQRIAFHRSASGTGPPIRPDPGAPASDSDIFVASVCDLLAGVPPTNITNSAAEIDDDASWSPDGLKIAWTPHSTGDNPVNSPTKEVYVMDADGSGRVRLTTNTFEERAPAWSPDGTRLAYMCRTNVPGGTGTDFEICVMNADGSAQTVLTSNTVVDATPSFSPDGRKIAFHRQVPGQGLQIFVMDADGSGFPTQLTTSPGQNTFPSHGEIKAGALEAVALAAGGRPEAFKDQFRCSRTSSTGP